MGNVVSINRGKARGGHSAQKAEAILEHGPFVLGVLAAIAALVVFCASGGPVSPWVVVVGTEAGVIGGLVSYILPHDEFTSIGKMQTEPVSLNDRTRQRKLS